jgi:CheY-like chemotaxis protein
MDWLMPGLNGIEAAKKIKTEIKPAVDPHIIMVSGFSATDVKGQSGAKFIHKFLSKPVSPSDIFDAVMEAFGVESERKKRGYSGGKFDKDMVRPIHGARLLLVEDNEINQQVASELLQQERLYVDIANHGQEALDMLEPGQYDAVLMDMQMPVMDGLTATTEIRKDERFKDLPILAMTANATAEDRARCEAAGMNDHIAKPIVPRVLFDALLRWVPHGERELPDLPDGDAMTESTGEALPEIPGIDTFTGVERIGGNVAAYRRLLAKFAENQADAVQIIRAALAASDHELSVRTAHTLKGVSGSIGANAVQQAAAKLESALKEDPDDLPEHLLAEVEAALLSVLEPIHSMLAADTESAGTQPGELPADLGEQLEALNNLLDEYDTEAGDRLDSLLEQLKGTALYDELSNIRLRLDQYDFEGAVEALAPLLEQHA